MILSDRDILMLIKSGELAIEPFNEEIVRENGLDLRLGKGYCAFRAAKEPLDPRNPGSPELYYDCRESDRIIIEPHRHYLLHTEEYIRLPPFVAGLVNLRSTWARTGIYIPSTVVDAGFEGQLTIEVIGSEFPVVLYPGDRFLHLVLVKLETPSQRPYSGEYKGQVGVRLPKFFSTKAY